VTRQTPDFGGCEVSYVKVNAGISSPPRAIDDMNRFSSTHWRCGQLIRLCEASRIMCLVLSQPRFGGTEEDHDFLDPA
jgi:hypothetical protein